MKIIGRLGHRFLLRTLARDSPPPEALVGFAAGLIVVALGVTAVLNHKTMVTLVDSEQTEVLAHRGFIQGGLENTLPALQAAARAGADRVEFDVLETKDGKFVVMHDTNLQRLAGKNPNVKDLTQDELTKITVRAGGMEAKIPSLEEWIQLSIQLNLPSCWKSSCTAGRPLIWCRGCFLYLIGPELQSTTPITRSAVRWSRS
jgi:glycerophosphoryl diester phosphodiesterase